VFLAVPIAFLALLNYYHSQIILRQREWYNAIDERIRQTLNGEAPVTFMSHTKFGGTHHIYSRIHTAIVCFLIVTALLVAAHGISTR